METQVFLHLEDEPFSPELVLVDPVLRGHLALREAYAHELAAPPVAEVVEAAAPVAVEPVGRRPVRRVLVAAAIVIAIASLTAAGVFAGLLAPGHKKSPTTHSTGAAAGTSARTFGWAPVARASEYSIEIFRNSELVYASTTRNTRIRVPGRWRHNGSTTTLSPGAYRWYVWPLFHDAAGSRRGAPIVSASLEIAS